MATRACIQYQGDPEIMKKNFLPEVKASIQEIIFTWHEHILPDHFKTNADDKYGYRSRTKKYMLQKAKKKGHQKPLMWSKNLWMSTLSRGKITGSSRSARITMVVPWYATKHFKGTDTYGEELTAVTLNEADKLAHEMQERLVIRLKSVQRKSPVRKRVK
jgi:hypothetical protein